MTASPADPREELIEHLPALRAFALSLTRNSAAADDLVLQEQLDLGIAGDAQPRRSDLARDVDPPLAKRSQLLSVRAGELFFELMGDALDHVRERRYAMDRTQRRDP